MRSLWDLREAAVGLWAPEVLLYWRQRRYEVQSTPPLRSWACTMGGVSGEPQADLDLLVPGTCAPRALQSMLTPKSPCYLPSRGPRHLSQATIPSLCFCSWQSSWWFGTSHQGSSFPNCSLTQCGCLGSGRLQEDGGDHCVCPVLMVLVGGGWRRSRLGFRPPVVEQPVILSLEVI